MSNSIFRIDEHILPCQHIRGYPRGTIDSQEEVLQIAVKQYTPLDNLDPQPGDITIIGAHANGFPKELYEPFWDSLHSQSRKHNFRIRQIIIADIASQGHSSYLNRAKLGNDPSWYDHSYDLLGLINHFRPPRPLFGVGHSMGGAQLTYLALFHQRLFEGLVLIDPVILRYNSRVANQDPAAASAARRDRWPSRRAAQQAWGRSKFYQRWDSRVLERWVQFGVRDVPGTEGKDGEGPEVELATPKHQEVFQFLRPKWTPDANENQRTHPDIDHSFTDPNAPLYRSESLHIYEQLPHLRPGVLYVFGEESNISSPFRRQGLLESTSAGTGGSGGVKQGRVSGEVVDGVGHLVPMEKPDETAAIAAGWLGRDMERWREWEEASDREWSEVPKEAKAKLSDKYLSVLGVKRREKL